MNRQDFQDYVRLNIQRVRQSRSHAYLDPVSDEGILEAPLETIRRMIQVCEEGAEIVLIDGTWYTNLPE